MPDSFVSRLARGDLTVEDCPPEVAEVLALGRAGAAPVPRGLRRTPAAACSTRAAWSRAGPSSGRPARCARCPDTDVCLSAGGDLVCHVAGPASPDWRIGIEDPHDPTRVLAVVPVRNGAVATSAWPIAAATSSTPGPAPYRRVASVTVVHDDLTWADIDATAAFAMGRDAARWLAPARAAPASSSGPTAAPSWWA